MRNEDVCQIEEDSWDETREDHRGSNWMLQWVRPSFVLTSDGVQIAKIPKHHRPRNRPMILHLMSLRNVEYGRLDQQANPLGCMSPESTEMFAKLRELITQQCEANDCNCKSRI